MQKVLLFPLLLVCMIASSGVESLTFQDFQSKHKRVYGSLSETQKRERIFADNVKKMKQLNKNSAHVVFDVNAYSDLTPE